MVRLRKKIMSQEKEKKKISRVKKDTKEIIKKIHKTIKVNCNKTMKEVKKIKEKKIKIQI